jgi:UDP-N-acetylmuramoyl-tripeptide--D-alanyl-D-alanine ligase
VPFDQIITRARELRPAPHRGAVIRLTSGVTVVDDSYNSSPTALQRALEVIARDRGAARKAAVRGEMLELGEHSHTMHAECGRAAASAKLDRLITVGGAPAGVMAEAAVRAGLPNDVVTWAPDSGAAADLILSWLSPGDLVLVKGSRGIKTDAVVDRITAEYA